MARSNEIQVGFSREEPGEVSNQIITRTGVQTVTRKITRHVGSRMMHANMLDRLVRWANAYGFEDAVPYLRSWLYPDEWQPRPAEATAALLARLRANMGHGTHKEDAYLEAMIFCVEAQVTGN